jgi:isopentenyl-diphosphate delta-isomerase
MEVSQVILVNEKDEVLGAAEKLKAHQEGLLHRAFSIFIFNADGQMLLQQRALHKYHSGGLWTNACCSHPMPNESTANAAIRRLQEEMGFTTPITKAFDFVYKVNFDNGLAEYEFDHVYTGTYEGIINYNEQEVMAYRYMNVQELQVQIQSHPTHYTEWFKIAFPKILQWWANRFNTKVA